MFWQVKGNAVNRKQYVAVAFSAAIPSYLLIAAVVWGLFQGGMLSDGAKMTATLWVLVVVSSLCGIIIGVLPFAVVIFPGLSPTAPAGVATAQAGRPAELPAGAGGKVGKREDEEIIYEESAESADEFGDASEFDEFDEFAEEVEEEPPQPKKKGRK